MIGFLFIYFIGKYFYQLAEKYNENKWLYAILGVVVYYSSGAISAVLLASFALLVGFEIDWDNLLLTSVLALSVGISSCWLFYYLLEKKWKKKQIKPINEINEIGNNSEI